MQREFVILNLINDKNEQVVDAAIYAIGELGNLQVMKFFSKNLKIHQVKVLMPWRVQL